MEINSYSSRKKPLLFLGYGLIAIGIAVFFQFNLKSYSVEYFTQFNFIYLFISLFGVVVVYFGNNQHYFLFYDNTIEFWDRKLKFSTTFSDIYHIKIFATGNSSQFSIAIAKESDKSVFKISTSFFDSEELLKVARRFKNLSVEFSFLFEDEPNLLKENK
jgi:hypothetical protein